MSIIHWVPLQMLILLVMASICIGIQNLLPFEYRIENNRQNPKVHAF